jgi:hypothetical protein
MKPLDLFRLALAEIGDVPDAEISAHLEKKHGVKIEPAFIPVFKATLQDFEKLTRLRQNAKTVQPIQPAEVCSPSG